MDSILAGARTKTGGDRGTYIYIGAYSAVLYMVLLTAPVIASKLVAQFGLTATQVGGLLSMELGAFSLATIPAYLWLKRVNLVTATRVFTLVAVAGNVVSGFADNYALLAVCRIVTSLAAGSITVVILSLSGRSANPGRAYGLFVAAQLVMGAVILALFPVLFADSAVSAIYWTMAGLALCCMAVAHRIDGNVLLGSAADPAVDSANYGHRPAPRSKAFLALAAVMLFYLALSGVWSFMGQFAASAQINLGTTSLILAVATVPGIASSLLATFLGDHPRRPLFLILGYLAMLLSIGLLFGLSGAVQFAAAAIIFKFSWTFILPYLLSTVSDLDSSGHLMNSTNLMIGTGFALGPVLGGMLIEAASGFGVLLVACSVGVLLSMTCVVLVQGRNQHGLPQRVAPMGIPE